MRLTEEERKQTGLRIKQIRLTKKMSMQEFAKAVDPDGKAQSGTVSNWETGKNAPNKKRLETIASLGNVSLEFLTNGFTSDKYKKIKELRNKLAHGIINNEELSEEDKKLINENNIAFRAMLNEQSQFKVNHILDTFSLENVEKVFSTSADLSLFMYNISFFISAIKNKTFSPTDTKILIELETLLDCIKILLLDPNEDDKKILLNELKAINDKLDKLLD